MSCPGVTVIHRYTDVVLITHNSTWLGRSCPSSTVPQQMLPCCECHPGQDHVTQNRVQCAQSTAGTAQMGGGGGAIDCVCRSARGYCLQNIEYQYQLQLSFCLERGIRFCVSVGLMQQQKKKRSLGLQGIIHKYQTFSHYFEWMLNVICASVSP